jgi:murein DD-endopeptidase MepM/ murein hydrolase activator NlpD
LKRALKKREKAVLKNNPSSDDALVEHLDNLNNVVNPKVKRRVRTKAAMIGLAISMGATSLLVTRQSEQAQAADPVGSQKPTTTIPAAGDTTVKFAPTTLNTQTVLPANWSENPVIVEPTAISQLPGLEAKFQVAASGMSVPVPSVTSDSLNIQTSVSQGAVTQNETGEELSSADSINHQTEQSTADISSEVEPQAVENTDGEINAQLKAQQQFALNRLQEKSNRLRNSLAELRSEETQVLSQTDIDLTEPKTESAPQISATPKALEESSIVNHDNTEDLLSRLRQVQETRESDSQPLTTTLPATPQVVALLSNTTYQVRPGDTLAAIATRYNTSISELVAANNLSNPNQLRINQTLTIPATPVNRSGSVQIPVVVNTNNTAITNPQLPNYTASPFGNQSIQVNTVATETTSDSANAQGVGGDSPVPTIFAEIQEARQSRQLPAPTTDDNEHLRLLRSEIERLQERHRNQRAGNFTEEIATEPETPAAHTPNAQTNRLQAEIRRLQEKYRNQQVGNGTSPAETAAEPIRVAQTNTLEADIQRLREQFRQQQSGNVTIPVVTSKETTVPSTRVAQTNSPEAEIQRLREQYRQQQSGNSTNTAATPTQSTPIPIPVRATNNTPAFSTSAAQNTGSIPIHVPSLNAATRNPRPNEPVNPQFSSRLNQSGTSANNTETTDNLGNLRGTRVTPQFQPQLPPLAAVEHHLPKPIDTNTPAPATATTAYIWPAQGVLTSGYGRRWGRMHRGIDIANATGTPIFAAADGIVETSGWNRGGFGILVDIRHPDGSLTRYAHNNRTLVRVGQRVTQGQQIAEMGSTGFSTGPHIHFEIHPPGRGATDPIAFLPGNRPSR